MQPTQWNITDIASNPSKQHRPLSTSRCRRLYRATGAGVIMPDSSPSHHAWQLPQPSQSAKSDTEENTHHSQERVYRFLRMFWRGQWRRTMTWYMISGNKRGVRRRMLSISHGGYLSGVIGQAQTARSGIKEAIWSTEILTNVKSSTHLIDISKLLQ